MFNRSGHKYGAVRTEVDGIKFSSKKEARKYGELKLLEKAGEIAALQLQPRFPIGINGIHICHYVGDFQFFSKEKQRFVVVDVKGVKTPIYRLKKKLMLAVHGIEIQEE